MLYLISHALVYEDSKCMSILTKLYIICDMSMRSVFDLLYF